jgi:hypothetical protein
MKTGSASRRARWQEAWARWQVAWARWQFADARWQEAWAASPASHPPDLAGIPTTCPNSLLTSKSNAQLMGVVYNKHGQAAAG